MAYEYLFSRLPRLDDEPGAIPAIAPRELSRVLAEEGGVADRLGRALLLKVDLHVLSRLAIGAEAGIGAVYSDEALAARQGLPHWLDDALRREGESHALPFDLVWKTYYAWLYDLSDTCDCSFLRTWLRWDVGFRNALVRQRAGHLHQEAGAALVDPGPHRGAQEFKMLIEGLDSIEASAKEPQDADRYVAQQRLAQLQAIAPIYTFDLDELLGYVARFVVQVEASGVKQEVSEP